MWPFVLLAYAFSNLVVGTVLHPAKLRRSSTRLP
jgi:hypothetical protein